MVQWKQQNEPDCPRCGEVEDTTHVWRCQQEEAQNTWIASLRKLRTWMERQQTAPEVRETVLEYLRSWKLRETPQLRPNATNWPDLAKALHEQAEIGWDSFIEGRTSKYWEAAQAHYYKWINSRKSARRWISALIQKIWDVAWDQWQHRNATLHQEETTASQRRIDQAIEEHLNQGARNLRGANRRFFQHANRVRQLNPAGRTAWLRNVEAAFARTTVRRTEDSSLTGQQDRLSAWLRGEPVP